MILHRCLTYPLLVLSLAIATLTVAHPANASSQPVTYHTADIDGASVAWLLVDTTDPRVHIQPVVAHNHFGTVAPLATLAASDHAIAAINGTFFNDPGNLQPDGSLEINGICQHGDKGTVLAVAPGNRMLIARAYPSPYMQIGNHEVWLWGINSWFPQATAIAVLTPMYGKTTGIANGTSVVVINQKVASIHHGNTLIPSNGYVIEWGDSAYNQNFLSQFVQKNLNVTFQITLDDYHHQTVPFPTPVSAISAGPMLVNHGTINLDPTLEGFTDPKLIDTDTTRTMIGITKQHQLVLALITTANLAKEAAIAKQMGLVAAMNMDGAASSGMYFNGRYVIRPTRDLATALTVTLH